MNTRQAILLKAAYDLLSMIPQENYDAWRCTYDKKTVCAGDLLSDIEDELGLCNDDYDPNDYERPAPIDRGEK